MAVDEKAAGRRRRHTTGEATRELLMTTAERLFAERGVEGVTLREIQMEAGQSNSSVITYHFGSKAGLVRDLIAFRYRTIDARRAVLLEEARADGVAEDPLAAVWLVVRPLIESIEAGEMFVPFLARLAPATSDAEYWPRQIEDATDVLQELVPELLGALPDRVRRGREVQLYNSVLNLLGDHARNRHPISDAQLNNYIDGWVGMLTAPVSAVTYDLMEDEARAKRRRG
ncbi:TetR/AcrR family transcriptional regulator [Streptomyces sp. STR69]|uniref:TetR/AcrR family transcriptional regulator n=1 Tax=Streptomyces sp. STR69 TaxID=1796942 RepID=UPI0021C8060F|nr:TetR/AcrR family transcriptional regulator [Streptomyces sp. STR69]